MEFSYRGQPIYAEVDPGMVQWKPPPFEGIEYREEERLRDLLNGGASVVMGGLFLALHWALRNRVERQKERPHSFLNKAYLMVSGVVYGGLSLVLIPMGLYQLVEFYFVPRGDPTAETFWSRPIPGDTLGYALVALVLWLWILPQLFKSLGGERLEE